jgi:hypothetical protein
MSELKQVWSSGGGVQSCAIAALILADRLPKPDYAVIADTGREKSTTWKYMEAWVKPALAAIGVELSRAAAVDYSPSRNEIFAPSGDLLMPAFTTEFGTVGKLSSFCSDKWKIRTVNNFLSRNHGITRSKMCKWVGYSRDEQKRFVRMMQGEEWKAGLLRLPLVHDVPTNRREAVALVEAMGWPTPPRSACWCCPNQSDDEWRELREESPLEFQQAVELEKEIQRRDPTAWLHKSCKPLSEVDFTEDADLFSRACDSGACFI